MRRIKPVARVGAVDINVRYDIHQRQKLKFRQNNGCSDECYDILEGEVLYRTKTGNFYRDNSIHLLSCTNGFDVERDEIEVCGVAVTGFSPKLDVYEQGFVLQVSGLTTIYNNSSLSINAGDSVYVQNPSPDPNYVPQNNPTGVPRKKNLLVLSNTFNDNTLGFLGTCVKGGRSKSSIDIVLHRGRQSQFPPIPVEGRETKFNEQMGSGLNGDLGNSRNGDLGNSLNGDLDKNTSSRLPAKKVRKKSSK